MALSTNQISELSTNQLVLFRKRVIIVFKNEPMYPQLELISKFYF